ncbi:uncharacterized protein LOC121388019 [Gigantopelta aegis]|uniref:uncharacterized protein LOC121388019 n=1 Tax=Gigantopelta aegis TaxID=1735272 RepID=UPI001B88C1FD|nr:uncharacterized protein LOC121388019 [Gigantopelta aegis]
MGYQILLYFCACVCERKYVCVYECFCFEHIYMCTKRGSVLRNILIDISERLCITINTIAALCNRHQITRQKNALWLRKAFDSLRRGTQVQGLVTLMDYVDRTWMRSSVWSVSAWSVFNQSVRTNNDVEGWHHRLNHRALGTAPPFYMLHTEARLVPLTCRFVSERKMRRRQRKAFRNLQGKIFELWRRYADGEVSTSRFLSACGKLYAPVAH